MSRKIFAADLFCGAGGTSTGLVQCAQALGYDYELVAVNHWDVALSTHQANHPDARHFNDPIDRIKPRHAVPGGKLDILWASPECTNHSRAKGGRPRDEQSRATAWDVLKWAQELYVKTIGIENVPEIMEWGPLGSDGKPLKSKRGDTFRAWLSALHSLGYRTEFKTLNCADYGDATTRERFFLLAHRGRRPITWPTVSHSGNGSPALFDLCQPWRTAREIIDWTIPGHSIFATREQAKARGITLVRPLADNTIKRIEAGIRKFWGAWAEPFLIVLNSGGHQDNARSINAPFPTITAGGQHVGIVQPFLLSQHSCGAPRSAGSPISTICTDGGLQLVQPFLIPNFGERPGQAPRFHDPRNPLPAVTGHGAGGLVQPFMVRFNGSHLGKTDGDGRIHEIGLPLPVQDTSNRYGVVEPFLVEFYGNGQSARISDPMNTITTHERFGLVRPMLVKIGGQDYLLDILFRMLTPAELAAAHSFPADYKFSGNKSDVVKQIGNSVPVATARALCGAALAA